VGGVIVGGRCFYMKEVNMSWGEKRGKVMLWAKWLGGDLVTHIFNENAHIGAVALGEYDLYFGVHSVGAQG
jgi:hypothetical protein